MNAWRQHSDSLLKSIVLELMAPISIASANRRVAMPGLNGAARAAPKITGVVPTTAIGRALED
jgi:hypothetical protein